ncbi:hypothetical protein LIER_24154 [Lithospermum erythrorhizon]|uniref:Uncharacterized protein n=1 Tax=Lithospermum erythrorhizon TaxID=34254 RepID=A0AAV3R0A4_LITER
MPGLPLYLFNEEASLSVSNTVGKPISLDNNNVRHFKLGIASVCVEMDVSNPRMNETCIGFEQNDIQEEGEVMKEQEGLWQKIVYDDICDYCTSCFHLVHKDSQCKHSKGKQVHPSQPPALSCANLVVHTKVPKSKNGLPRPIKWVQAS